MSLKCQVQVTLNNISEEMAQTVIKALEPDNVNFPKGLSLEMKNVDGRLVFDFTSQVDMKSLVSTVDEVIEHIQVALKVIQ